MKKPGEKGPFGKGLLLLSPVPPPLIPPNVLTGGEAARREFVPMRVRKNKFLRVDWDNAFPHAR